MCNPDEYVKDKKVSYYVQVSTGLFS
ncbi:hypothetical protein F383_21182 [Gossypium arboreum]|uniref:Uncharacterized protein n=1 Tax=Gossypium arboreum TaxID=29729 RepID=A0A0B0MEX4_GOSAR|nr:hypothetical protein F383_21182 [Gossypium arboreum]